MIGRVLHSFNWS